MQYLTMPFARQMMLTGYQAPPYQIYWGYPHYGVDISSQYGAGGDKRILASGEGEVSVAGYDMGVGNCVVIRYHDARNHKTGEQFDVIARYYHMASLSVSAGQKVSRGTLLGLEGNTKTGDVHLHLEFDTDLDYPAFSPQVKGANLIKSGVDTTINPCHLLYIGEGQAVVPPTYNPSWLGEAEKNIPALPKEDHLSLYEQAARERDEWKEKYQRLCQSLENLVKAI